MKKKNLIILIVSAVIITLLAVFAYIHRNVIKAMIKGEELPALPEGHPHCCHNGKKGKSCCKDASDDDLDDADIDYYETIGE